MGTRHPLFATEELDAENGGTLRGKAATEVKKVKWVK
jgi:hypothetical protein